MAESISRQRFRSPSYCHAFFHPIALEADTGELVCNYPHLHSLIGGSKETLKKTLEQMMRSDVCNGAVAESARDILELLNENSKTFQSIAREANNKLAIFDRRGLLGQNCELSTFDPDDLKRKNMSVFIMAPPEKINGPYGAWMGLVVNTLINAVMRARKMHPRCTFILDEFANLSPGPLPSIIPALYVGRSYGCQLWPMIQNRDSLKRYGDEWSAFESQSEIITCWGIRTNEDARWVEEKSAQFSAVTESPSLPVADDTAAADGRYSIGLSEKGLPVIRRDQATQLPDYTQIIFFKNRSVSVGDLVSFRAVDPWRAQVTPLPGDENEPELPVRFDLTQLQSEIRRPN